MATGSRVGTCRVAVTAFVAAAALASTPDSASAQEFPIAVTSNLKGLNVKVEPVIAGPVVIVKLTNQSPGDVRCTLEFINGPQIPVRQTRKVPAGKEAPVVFRATVEVIKLDVDVQCEPDNR